MVGGSDARIADWPGFVTLRNRHPSGHFYFCGGTAIAPSWVLTAAHCFDEVKQEAGQFLMKCQGRSLCEIEVVHGVDNLRDVKPNNVRKVAQLILRDGYQPFDALLTGNDLALIKLSAPVSGPFARLSAGAASDPPALGDGILAAAGFGALKGTEDGVEMKDFTARDGTALTAGSDKLLAATLPFVSRQECKKRHIQCEGANEQIGDCFITDDHLCAGGILQKDTCGGDSGGPLLNYDGAGCPHLVGVVSWGPKACGAETGYGVYTRVSAHLPWISEHVGTLGVEPQTSLPATKPGAAQQAMVRRLDEDLAPAKRNLTLSLSNKTSRIRLGSQYSFQITSQIDGLLILIDVNADGVVTQIFPNVYSDRVNAAGAVTAGGTIVVPGPGYGFDWFRAVEPAGPGTLIAVIVPPSFNFTATAAEPARINRGFAPEMAPANYLADIMTQIIHECGQGAQAEKRCGLAVMPYVIEP